AKSLITRFRCTRSFMARSTASARSTSSTEPTLWPHQLATWKFGSRVPCVLDTSDPGTGKTRAHIEIYRARKPRGRLRVVCPKTLIYSAWGEDINRFAPELSVSFATAEQRKQAFEMRTN